MNHNDDNSEDIRLTLYFMVLYLPFVLTIHCRYPYF